MYLLRLFSEQSWPKLECKCGLATGVLGYVNKWPANNWTRSTRWVCRVSKRNITRATPRATKVTAKARSRPLPRPPATLNITTTVKIITARSSSGLEPPTKITGKQNNQLNVFRGNWRHLQWLNPSFFSFAREKFERDRKSRRSNLLSSFLLGRARSNN